ncbi:hypothetical protein ABB37_04519 [Leptomonas pyrrhocoris]|uniref:Uncharacterized protein n=1 Tax=Leptomonas pyrrhocoris TaxID=157538 RepID=A0A0N0DW80_LEPPY|nr:hypothetical protein ABB37_04519 [Leptomonas pyrrhocoris]KPA81181.1 hypothetical protein ABB37_04519 [Leptomonas pyrrhocoris]|eukprot:XP_015659620.1 hypothetical protein ABB37_04519 [Leptomonas pyrrhocoris]
MSVFSTRKLFLTSFSSSPARRCTWRRITDVHRQAVSSLQRQSRSAASTTFSPAPPSADAAVELFATRLLSAPHRDATHVAYGDWFTLYVGVRKGWKATATSNAQRRPLPGQGELRHDTLKRSIDALFWTSLFARHWSEVQLHTTVAPSASHYRWWWHPEASWQTRPAALELCSCDFLTEPLLGGRYLRLWMEDVRAAAAALDAHSAANTDEMPTVIVPFSALWAIKRSAYWRPSTQQSEAASPPGAAVAAASPLSLQERQARQALLQTVDQLLQLQCDAATRSGQLQRICVLSPTQEWDLMCQAPRFRQALNFPASTVIPPSPPPPRWLSIGCMCEEASARLAYCAHALYWQQQQQQRTSSDEASQLTPVRVLAPSTEHARLRAYALTSVHEHSREKAALEHRQTARQQRASSSSVSSAAAATTVHGQARRGCSDAARRMSTREENLRQSFSVR